MLRGFYQPLDFPTCIVIEHGNKWDFGNLPHAPADLDDLPLGYYLCRLAADYPSLLDSTTGGWLPNAAIDIYSAFTRSKAKIVTKAVTTAIDSAVKSATKENPQFKKESYKYTMPDGKQISLVPHFVRFAGCIHGCLIVHGIVLV